MKARELNCEVCRKISSEKEEKVKKVLEEKRREIEKTEVILNKLQRQYEELLEKDIDEIYYNRCW